MTLTPHSLLVLWSWKGRAIPLLPSWAVWPVQSLSACTRAHFLYLYQLISCTAGIIWSLASWWDAPENLVCSKSNVFIFNPSMMFLDGDLLQYGLLCILPIVSHVFTAVFWKLDLFLLSDARRESYVSVQIKSLLSYTRPFPKCHTWNMSIW
jgi:hypothetical protein